MAYSERIKKIREHASSIAQHEPENTYYYDLHNLALNKFHHLEKTEKIARSTAGALKNQKIYIEDFDNLIGRVFLFHDKPVTEKDEDFDCITEARKRIFAEIEDYQDFAQIPEVVGDTCYYGHISWNWNSILKHGTSGLKRQCELELKRKKDEKSQQFYKGVHIMLSALEDWNEAHVKELEKRGMTKQAQICKQVPKYPARNFYEAVQAFYMQYIAVMREFPGGGNSPGRLDYYLWPYLEKDLQDHTCTLEKARELIDELLIRINERIWNHDGWVETIVVGGTHANGSSAVNPLTYIIAQSYIELDMVHPAVYIRIPENPPKELVDFCAKYMVNGQNRAQLLNDKAIIRALIHSGVEYRDAVDYYCGGCMEIGIQGMTNDFLFNAWHNMPKMVELAVTKGVSLTDQKVIRSFRSKGLENYHSFEEFYQDFIGEVQRILHMFFKAQEIYSEIAETARPCFLLCSMLNDCMAKGRTIHGGGTRYFDYGSTPIGMPDAADYLFAIKKAVFEDNICTAAELVSALKANFKGYEALRSQLLQIPKYGQENAEADAMARRYFSDVCDIYASYTNRYGGRGKIVVFTFTWAADCGAALGATASGKLAGQPVAHGVTPHSASMSGGITSAMNSCTTIDFEKFNGGASTMWDFDSSWVNEDIINTLFSVFFEKGGQIFQGNTTSVEELLLAQKNPEAYQNLMIRVGGFSARFVTLSKEVQDEIINRKRHAG